MTKNPARRLGCSGNESQIRSHAFFKDLDWEALEQRRVKPPFRPRVVRIIIFMPSPYFYPNAIANVRPLLDVNYRKVQRMLWTSIQNLQKKSQYWLRYQTMWYVASTKMNSLDSHLLIRTLVQSERFVNFLKTTIHGITVNCRQWRKKKKHIKSSPGNRTIVKRNDMRFSHEWIKPTTTFTYRKKNTNWIVRASVKQIARKDILWRMKMTWMRIRFQLSLSVGKDFGSHIYFTM